MNTPARWFSVRSTLVMYGLAIISLSYLAQPVLAADAAAPNGTAGTTGTAGTAAPVGPPPSISVDVKKGDDKVAAGGAAGGGSRGGGYNMSSSTMMRVSQTKGESRYIVTLHNSSKFAAKNLEVEYHIYNETINTHNGISSEPGLQPYTEKLTVDSIDPGKSATLQTLMIPHENTQTQLVPMGTNSKPDSTVLVTSLLAWSVDVRFNGKVIAHRTSDNFDARMKQFDTGR